jgi:hypothetical protein
MASELERNERLREICESQHQEALGIDWMVVGKEESLKKLRFLLSTG